MLDYSRCKCVGVQVQDDGYRVVSGVLEDELYAMQCEIVVNWPELTIEKIRTRMKRFTTERCLRAEDVFVKAEGWKLDSQLEGRIKKELGRHGCRHMAILMVDCCRSLARSELARELRAALEKQPDIDTKQFLDDFFSRYPGLVQYLQLQ